MTYDIGNADCLLDSTFKGRCGMLLKLEIVMRDESTHLVRASDFRASDSECEM